MIFSGSWSHCWLEYGTEHRPAVQGRDQQVGADANKVLVVLNNPNTAGAAAMAVRTCRWASTGTVIAHEFGHGIGGFADEYSDPGPTPAANRAGST